MRRVTTATSDMPSIAIVLGAYEQFFAPKEQEITALEAPSLSIAFALTAGPQIVLVTAPNAGPWLKFKKLVDQWQDQRGAMSSTTEAVMCPAYQSIIGLGEAAVPFILKQLELEGDDPDQWFWALTAITGESPEHPDDKGNYVKMAVSWFKWAKDNGYAW